MAWSTTTRSRSEGFNSRAEFCLLRSDQAHRTQSRHTLYARTLHTKLPSLAAKESWTGRWVRVLTASSPFVPLTQSSPDNFWNWSAPDLELPVRPIRKSMRQCGCSGSGLWVCLVALGPNREAGWVRLALTARFEPFLTRSPCLGPRANDAGSEI